MNPYSHDLTVHVDFPDHGHGVALARIEGSIDTITCDDLLATLQQVLKGGKNRVVADLGKVGYISSAGLGVILQAAKEARGGGGDIRLAAASDKVSHVLKLSGFSSIFRIYPDTETALTSFND